MTICNPPSEDARTAEPQARSEIEADLPAGPAAPAEVREALDRARSYAFLWLLTHNQIMRQVEQLEKHRLDAPKLHG